MLTLQNEATINCLNSLQQTPLAVAAAYNHVPIIDFLLTQGAQIECKDKDGYTPLLLAASEGNAKAVSVLLQSGANIFSIDREDRTVLYWASVQNHKNVVDVICYFGLGLLAAQWVILLLLLFVPLLSISVLSCEIINFWKLSSVKS